MEICILALLRVLPTTIEIAAACNAILPRPLLLLRLEPMLLVLLCFMLELMPLLWLQLLLKLAPL